jgi:hypothetical protein
MTMQSRVWALAVVMITAWGPAVADPKVVRALGENLPQPGALFEDVRAMTLAPGGRIVCESDADKPPLSNPGLMKAQRSRGADHVRRCSVFVDDGKGIWQQAQLKTAFGEARMWLIFIEHGAQGRYRLAQFSLWANRASWDRAAGLLGVMLGQPATQANSFLGWQDEQHETQMFIDERRPDEFAVAVGDQRLRKLIKSPGAAIRE